MAQPQQDRGGNRELRSILRGLVTRVKKDKHNLTRVENNSIVAIVMESNQYVEQVTRPRDQAVDAEMFSLVTEAGLEYFNRLKQGGRQRAAGDLIRRLKARHVAEADAQAAGAAEPEAFNWAELGGLPTVALLFRGAPVVHHMLGPMGAAPRQRRQAQRQAKRSAPLGEAVRPEEVADLRDAEKQETDRNMEEMWGVLHAAGGRANLVDLVLNRDSFAQTVENLFTLSFLVRDNKVGLEPDTELGTTVVQRAAAKGEPKEREREADRHQFVVALDIDTWEAMKQATDPSQPPMMKHRKSLPQQQQQRQQEEQQRQQQADEQAAEEELGPSQRRRQSCDPRLSRQQQQQTHEQQQADPQQLEGEAVAAGGSQEAAPPPGRRQSAMQHTPSTQQTQPGTQGASGQRAPKRGRR